MLYGIDRKTLLIVIVVILGLKIPSASRSDTDNCRGITEPDFKSDGADGFK